MKRSTVKFYLIILLTVFAVFACTPYPRVTYYEMDEAIDTAETQEEKEYYEKQRDIFEANVIKAEEFYTKQARCEKERRVLWACSVHHRYRDKPPFKNLDDLVRAYLRERSECACVDRDSQLDQLGF